MMLYEAQVSWLHGPGETTSTIQFTADDMQDAIQAAWRFVRGRQRALPDLFGKIACVKIGALQLGPIDQEGNLQGCPVMTGYEWKCDWPQAELLIPEESRGGAEKELML